jgi:hypothetical protein
MSYHTFTEKSTCFIHNQSDAIITRPNLVYLPKYPVHMRAINIYNHTGGLITINSNSKTDLMHSSYAAPQGSNIITLEDKRMLRLTYILTNEFKKTGVWHIIRS